jgi:putative colanic acid biosysnthesis UDP-glucose lipid carrier transferase
VFDRLSKRSLDLLVAGMALVLLAPLMALVAIAVKLDSPGPVLFRQRRLGLNGREFRILKFRSMTVVEDGDKVTQAKRNDARITPFGRLIRSTSIDELPQLINVVRGEMSLVGPRPHAVAHDRMYEAQIADYSLRRRMKPGLTGWAQINGLRGETKSLDLMQRRVEHDLWYIESWTVWLDFKILFRTFKALFVNRDVY